MTALPSVSTVGEQTGNHKYCGLLLSNQIIICSKLYCLYIATDIQCTYTIALNRLKNCGNTLSVSTSLWSVTVTAVGGIHLWRRGVKVDSASVQSRVYCSGLDSCCTSVTVCTILVLSIVRYCTASFYERDFGKSWTSNKLILVLYLLCIFT